MKRDLPTRRLHMGCGEGLTGRVSVPTRIGSRTPDVAPARQAGSKAGKDKR